MKICCQTAILIIVFFAFSCSHKTVKNTPKKVPNSVAIIDNHLDQFFDESEDIDVLNEIESEIIHKDIYFIKATEDRPFHILLSCGMSALPMNVPKDIASSPYAEVMMLLPKEWNLAYESFKDEQNYWPMRIMKELMALPHPNRTWLGFGHTYGHEEDTEFAEGIGFNSVMLAHSMELSSDFTEIVLENDKVVEIYTLIPLYKEELEFKKQHSTRELLERFDKFGIEEIVKVGRKNVCL